MTSKDVERRVLDAVGRAMGRLPMLRPGDRVAGGVSGGKDSLCLLHAMVAHRRRAPFPYDLVALTVDQGKFTRPVLTLEGHIRKTRHPGVPESIGAALANVNPYTLFDRALTKDAADATPV
ncbi:MAG: hypothetical protein HY725_14730 [Candidatus Rokubacteria bacterium]|nr:hypothetical protein [Candidatus Rokubacteria bacterium]